MTRSLIQSRINLIRKSLTLFPGKHFKRLLYFVHQQRSNFHKNYNKLLSILVLFLSLRMTTIIPVLKPVNPNDHLRTTNDPAARGPSGREVIVFLQIHIAWMKNVDSHVHCLNPCSGSLTEKL